MDFFLKNKKAYWRTIMRLSIQQILLVALMSVVAHARESDAQDILNRNVTVRLSEVTLHKALSEIENKTKIRFAYSRSVINVQEKVSVTADNEPLSTVLNRLLRPVGIEYSTSNGQVMLRRGRGPSEPAPPKLVKSREEDKLLPVTLDRSLSGRVLDEKGEGLPGVSVIIKGSQRGTTTDIEGKFQLAIADDNEVLIFSFVGYESKELIVGAQTSMSVTLAVDTKSLEEVVVVGYGTMKRAEVTAAISSVPMSEIKDMPVSNLGTALQGKIAGVVVQQNNGTPGSTPAIKVRGVGSISAGNTPLIVVDGNIVGANIFSLLNSNDIESIDVLKDASSTAIYGSKGSNGVLLVTTKKGKSGKTSVNFDMFTGVQELSKKIDLLNSQQFAEFGKDASNNAYLSNVTGASINDPNSVRPTDFLRYRYPRGEVFDWMDFDNPTKLANLPYYDYQDMIFRKAKMNNYQLSVSGGNERARYLISGGYLQQDGIVKRSALDRYTLRANVEIDVLPKLKVGLNLNPSFKTQQEVKTEGHWADNAVINSALSVMPFILSMRQMDRIPRRLVLQAPTTIQVLPIRSQTLPNIIVSISRLICWVMPMQSTDFFRILSTVFRVISISMVTGETCTALPKCH